MKTKTINKKEAEQILVKLLPSDIKLLSEMFTHAGFELFLVGGCIRDTFVGKIPKDFDVCTNAMPEQVIEILKKNKVSFQLQGEAFGVVVAKMSEDFEIATFRSDVINSDNGKNNEHNVKLGVTINDDVERRDLTINALFMNLHTNTIIDLVGGIDDLNNNIIKTVGDPVLRFKEDNLRKLRTIRFASRLGFDIEDKTFLAIHNDPKLNVSGERIVNELENAFNTTKNLSSLITNLFDSNLIFEIFSGITLKNHNLVLENKITSFTTFIAELINTEKVSLVIVEKELHAKKLRSKLISGVLFLLNFNNIETIDIVDFIKKMKSTNLTTEEIVLFHQNDLFEKFCNFQIPKDIVQDLMDKGFTGQFLGEQIKNECNRIIERK